MCVYCVCVCVCECVLCSCYTAMDELPGVLCMRCDLLTPESHEHIETFLEGRKADVVMRFVCPYMYMNSNANLIGVDD